MKANASLSETRRLILGAILLGVAIVSAEAAVPIKVIPRPKFTTRQGDDLQITNRTMRITSASSNLVVKATERLSEVFGITKQSTVPVGGLDLVITYDSDANAASRVNEQGEQGYTLVVAQMSDHIKVTIAGGNEVGAYYGLCTLEQLISNGETSLIIPPVRIRDWPTIKERSFVLWSVLDGNNGLISLFSRLKFNQQMTQSHNRNRPDLYIKGEYKWGYKKDLVYLYTEKWENGVLVTGKFPERITGTAQSIYNMGHRIIVPCFDDINLQNGTVEGALHAEIVKIAYDYLKAIDPSVKIIMCPTPYYGPANWPNGSNYLREVEAVLPADIPLYWSGLDTRESSSSIWSYTIGRPDVELYQRGTRKIRIFENKSLHWSGGSGKPVEACFGRGKDLNDDIIDGWMLNINSEAGGGSSTDRGWKHGHRNVEIIMATCAMYLWSPETYDVCSAFREAKEYILKNRMTYFTEDLYAPVATNQTFVMHANDKIMIDLPVTDLNGDPLTYSILSNPANGTLTGIGDRRWYKPNAGYTGTDSFTFKASDDGALESAVATVTIQVIPENEAKVIAVNCGGPAYTASNGVQYAADYGYEQVGTSSKAYLTTSAIAGTTDDKLYQSMRWRDGGARNTYYSFPVPNGTYEVTLKWAEIANVTRRIDVGLESDQLMEHLMLKQDPGPNTAYDETFTVRVDDNVLDINLYRGASPYDVSIGAKDQEPAQSAVIAAIYAREILDPSDLPTSAHSVPYGWLESVGILGNFELAVTQDHDGDGFTAAEEYWSGTDPQAAESYLRIERLEATSSSIRLFSAHSNVDTGNVPPLVVQRRDSLTSGSWLSVTSYPPVDGTNMWQGPLSGSGFYRICATNMP